MTLQEYVEWWHDIDPEPEPCDPPFSEEDYSEVSYDDDEEECED